MPRLVQGPDGVMHQFPDQATDQQISAALKAIPQANAGRLPKARTWADVAADALPMIGGALGSVAGGAGGTVAGMGVGAVPGAMIGAASGSAIGESARQLLNRARGAEAPQSATAAAQDLAMAVGENAAAEGAGQVLGAGMKAAAPWLMAKVLKPSLSVLEEYKTTAPRMAKLLLDEGVNVTEGGLAKLKGLLHANTAKIDAAVAAAPGVIPKKEVAAELANTAARVAKQTNPTEGLKAIGDTAEEFLNHPVYTGDLTVPEAHAMKKATYQKLGNAYGEMKSASVEAEKALARGLKNAVADRTPGLAAMNAREAELMGAGEAVARRVATNTNADPVGILWASHDPAMFIAGLIQKQPVVRSMLANGMWANASRVAKVAPNVLRSAIYAIAEGVTPSEDEK